MGKSSVKQVLISIAVVMAILFIVAGIIGVKKHNRRVLDYQFKGKVDDVKYSDLGDESREITIPTITINGHSYFLLYHSWHFGNKIQKGDSMIKNKSSAVVTLIKMNKKKIIFGNE